MPARGNLDLRRIESYLPDGEANLITEGFSINRGSLADSRNKPYSLSFFILSAFSLLETEQLVIPTRLVVSAYTSALRAFTCSSRGRRRPCPPPAYWGGPRQTFRLFDFFSITIVIADHTVYHGRCRLALAGVTTLMVAWTLVLSTRLPRFPAIAVWASAHPRDCWDLTLVRSHHVSRHQS